MPLSRDFFADVTAIVMAGGKSSRMGTDKSQLPIGELPLIEYVLTQLRKIFRTIIISSNNKLLAKQISEQIVPDEKPGMGPVMGLISTMKKSPTDICFVQACDIPETNIDLLRKLLNKSDGFDAVVPRDSEGRVEPLFAVYKKSAVKAMHHVLEHEEARANRIVAHCKTNFLELTDSTILRNINTPQDYRSFIDK